MDPIPDPRLVERLVTQLRSPRVGASAWTAAGEALALAVLHGDVPWLDPLADAMVGSLLRVQDLTMDDADPADRVRLGLAAAVLSVARPLAVGRCDAAISTWIGWSAGSPAGLRDPDLLARWAVLGLLLRDPERAAEAVDALIELDPDGLGLLLHDWVVAVLQGQGLRRQSQAFHHLRTAMRVEGRDEPAMLLVAALVLVDAAGLPRRRVVGWLREVARELASVGTASCTPVPAVRRS